MSASPARARRGLFTIAILGLMQVFLLGPAPAAHASSNGAVQIVRSTGGNSPGGCALLASGKVRCWQGIQTRGAAEGSGDLITWIYDGITPNGWYGGNSWTVPSLSNVTQIADVGGATCALITDGTVKCWLNFGTGSWGGFGILGNGSWDDAWQSVSPDRPIMVNNAPGRLTVGRPVDVLGITNATSISGGGLTGCAVLADGTAKCWGSGAYRKYGDSSCGGDYRSMGSTSTCLSNRPVSIGDLGAPIKQIATSDAHACALLTTGAVKCWGQGLDWPATTASGSRSFKQISIGGDFVYGNGYPNEIGYLACGVTDAGGVGCFGKMPTDYGGHAIYQQNYVYKEGTLTSGVSSVAVIDSGGGCAVMNDGKIKCWGVIGAGSGWSAILGDYDGDSSSAPSIPKELTGWAGPAKSIAMVSAGICAIVRNDEVQCAVRRQDMDWGHTSLGNPANYIRVNPLGSAGSAPQTVSGLIPDVSINVPSLTKTRSASVTFSSVPGATHECSLDSAAWVPCTSPTTTPTLVDGDHTFAVRASLDGVTSYDTTVAWTVDTTRPAAPAYTAKPDALSNARSTTITWTGEDGAVFECSTDGGFSYSTCTSPKVISNMSDGNYSLKVRQTDGAGNVSNISTASWTIDIQPPAVPTLTSKPSAVTDLTTATIGWNAGEAGASFQCSIEHGAWSACTNPVSRTGLSLGDHEVWVRQVDAAGNTSEPAIASWTIIPNGGVAPVFSSGPGGYVGSSSATAVFAATGSNGLLCALDGGNYTDCTSPLHLTGLPEGSHTLAVKAVYDTTVSDATSITWTSDTVAPDAPSFTGAPDAATNATSATFLIGSEPGATLSCSTNGGAWTACTATKYLSGLAEGSYTLQVRQTDRAGNVSPVTSYSWTVDRTAPAAPTFTDGPSGAIGTSSTSFSFNGESGASFTCSLDGAPFTSCSSPKDLTGLAQGAHTLNVRQTDAAGNTSTTVTRSFTVDTTLPAVPNLSGAPAAFTSSKTASVGFSIANAVSYQCSVDGGAFTSCASPKALTGLADGAHSLAVRAVNNLGNAGPAATASWTVDTAAPSAPVIATKPAALTRSKTAAFTFTGEANSTFTCSLDGGTYSTCNQSTTLTNVTDGSHMLAVKQVDRAGNQSTAATATWTVDTIAPTAIKFTSQPTAYTNVATATFKWASPGTGNTVTCSLDGTPATTCTSPKTLTGLTDGTHFINVTISDTAGNSATTSLTWTVDVTAPTLASAVTGGKIIVGNNTILSLDPAPDTSGIAKVEWNTATKSPAANAKPVTSKTVNYTKPLTINSKTITWIRIQDTAGNWSKWYTAK